MRLALVLLLLAGCARNNYPVSKPGASKEQVDRDVAQCEDRARDFLRNRPATKRDQVKVNDRLVIDCLRDRGYTTSAE